MNKIILLSLSVLYSSMMLHAQNTQAQFIVKGKLQGHENGLIYLSYTIAGKTIKDSSSVKKGKFFFHGSVSEPIKAYLILKEVNYNALHSLPFFLEPSTIKIKIPGNDFTKAKITGSVTQNESTLLGKSKRKLVKKYQLQLDSLNTEKDSKKIDEIRERLAPYFRANDQMNFTFFAKNPQSYLAAFSLRIRVRSLSLDSLLMLYNAMTPKVKASSLGKLLGRDIELLAGGSTGSIAKNFTSTDINGNPLSLSDLKGKYVLLDFWASWCIPCRKENPQLVKLYNQYKEKGIEFIGVSDDDRNPAAWRNAVKQDSLPWLHVLRGLDRQKKQNDERNENDINENFGVHMLPTIILIDPAGVIIGRYVENKEELEKALMEIFKDKF